jgi:hypothetical protein
MRRALWCWAQKRTEWCERRGLRKTAIGAYILRLGASITLEDAHNGLLELIRSTTRGMAVRDMTIDTEGYWVACWYNGLGMHGRCLARDWDVIASRPCSRQLLNIPS